MEDTPNAQKDWRTKSTISVEDAGRVLGVSRGSSYRAANRGEIPTLKLGQRLVVPVAKLKQLLGEDAA